MAYLVLARKYRPQRFEEIVGQGQVSTTLVNAITQDRVAHAYLFCGPRGVGKTTAARILAKALNCEQGPTATPCNTCDACVSITKGSSMEVLEIDGASNRGINEVRELRENTRYAPQDGRTKVYIIDEVHMLTTEAFNALLKTLEEPPPHVVFVMATTDPFKVPGTILSRCQRFDFSRIATKDITEYLVQIVSKESADISEDALALLARRAQGGLRDALSMLDQVLSATDGKADRKTVEHLLGLVGDEVYFRILDAVGDQDAAQVLALLEDVYSKGAALEEVAQGLARHVRNLFVIRTDSKLEDLLETTSSELDLYRNQAERFSSEVLLELFSRMTGTAQDLRRSDDPRLMLELTLIDLLQTVNRISLADLAERLLAMEQRLGSGAPPPAAPVAEPKAVKPPSGKKASAPRSKKASSPRAEAVSEPVAASAPEPPPVPEAQPDTAEGRRWLDCLTRIKERDIVLWSKLHDIPAIGTDSKGMLVLQPDPKHALQLDALRDAEACSVVNSVLGELEVPGFVLSGQESKEEQPREEGDNRELGQVFKDEPKLQKVLDLFDGEVMP